MANDEHTDGQVVLVTGAAAGIGRGIVAALAERGHRVVALDRDRSALDAMETDDNVLPVQGDVTRSEEVARAVQSAREHFSGAPHSLVNNAGVLIEGDALSTTDSEWDLHFDVNVKGAWRAIREVLPGMLARGRGVIVNVVSIEGVFVGDRHFAYTASKGAMLQMAKSIAHDFGPRGIRCNVISPGAFDTPMLRRHCENTGNADEARARVESLTPVRRLGDPREVGYAVDFLISEQADFVNGLDFVLDGGRTLRT
jgi:2-keto-3-deoxy-L-fuconate dehydrogenase